MKTVVVIPTYDEKDNVEPMAAAVLANPGDIELLFVDDNSPDGTGAIVDAMAARDPRIHCLHRVRKEGLGRAYVAGFAKALELGAERVIQMDCDFSHDPKDVTRLVEASESADLVIGSRYVKGGATPGWPFKRRLISRCGGIFIRTVTGMPLRDPTGGFKCWRASALRAIDFESVASAGYSFQLEMNHRTWKKGLVVKELPITFTDRTRGYSKITGSIAVESVRIAWRLRRWFTFAVAALGSALALAGAEPKAKKPPAPIEWKNIDPAHHLGGRMASPGYLRGKVVMVDCRDYSKPSAIEAAKQMQALWDTFKSKPFVLVGSHRFGDSEVAKRRIKELGITYPVYAGAALAENEPGDGWQGEFIYAIEPIGRRILYTDEYKKATGKVGNAIMAVRVHDSPAQYRYFLDWELVVLPGQAYNTMLDFKKAYPNEFAADYAAKFKEFEANEAIVELAKLENICRQGRDYDSATGGGRLTPERVDLVIEKFSHLKQNANPYIVQEAKNCLADLKWLKATL